MTPPAYHWYTIDSHTYAIGPTTTSPIEIQDLARRLNDLFSDTKGIRFQWELIDSRREDTKIIETHQIHMIVSDPNKITKALRRDLAYFFAGYGRV